MFEQLQIFDQCLLVLQKILLIYVSMKVCET